MYHQSSTSMDLYFLGRPSLTFSARLNMDGKILDQKITPGIVRNVRYTTPGTVASILASVDPPKKTVISVGDDNTVNATIPSRPLQDGNDLTEVDEMNLKLLHTLGVARQTVTASKGAIMFSQSSSVQMSVSFSNDAMASHIDPSISLRAEGRDERSNGSQYDTVRNLMLLAGEVAARWCHDRGIPVINRVTQRNPDQPDPRDFFRREILPLLLAPSNAHDQEGIATTGIQMNFLGPPGSSGLVPRSVYKQYMSLSGSVLPSTVPAPHLALGVEKFTRATSPLRRYSDLLLHWQIEAALVEEARIGKSLVGGTREDFLPFKKAEIDKFIPHLENRERNLKKAEAAAQRFWAIQLLIRAWKFDEAQLPLTFQLVAKDVRYSIKKIGGELLDLGGLNALMDHAEWFNLEDIKAGDAFEVKIRDLNAYDRVIYVEPIRRVESPA
jgi:hypothetical protein